MQIIERIKTNIVNTIISRNKKIFALTYEHISIFVFKTIRATKISAYMYATNQAIANNESNTRPQYPLALPIAIATAGVGAILFAVYLANKKVDGMADDTQYDVENYEVKDKPYIYEIGE